MRSWRRRYNEQSGDHDDGGPSCSSPTSMIYVANTAQQAGAKEAGKGTGYDALSSEPKRERWQATHQREESRVWLWLEKR